MNYTNFDYSKVHNFTDLEWNNLFNNFKIFNILICNNKELKRVCKHFYFLLDVLIKDVNKLNKKNKELEEHKNDIDEEYEECVKNLDECENNNKSLNKNFNIIHNYLIFQISFIYIINNIFIEHYYLFYNILYTYYRIFSYLIISNIYDTDYTIINTSLFVISQYLLHKIYIYMSFYIFFKFNVNINLYDKIMIIIYPTKYIKNKNN